MSVAHSRQRQQWDPQALFEITNPNTHNSFTCPGWASTKDRRCENPIGKNRRLVAESLMNRLAFIEPRQIIEQEIPRLEDIAFHCLCRTHLEGPHGQWDSIVSEWVVSLEEEQTRLEFRNARREVERPERDASASARSLRSDTRTSSTSSRSESQDSIERRERSTSSAHSLMTPQSPETPLTSTSTSFSSSLANPRLVAVHPSRNQSQTQGDGEVNMYTREEVMRRDIQNQFENMHRELEDMRRAQDRLIQNITTLRTELQRPSEVDTVVSQPITLDQEQEPPLSTSPVLESDIRPDSELETEPTPPPPIAQPCQLHQISRRSIDEDCPICIMPMVNCMLSELVWCKQQCGRSVHKDCFEEMLEITSSNMRCVYCRSSWSGSCSHDEQPPEEFELWTQWDLRFDMLFDPRNHRYDFWNAAYETNLPSFFYSEQLHTSDENAEEIDILASDWEYDADDEA